ncbi:MAG: AtpZ/AtpI family protein [Deltaproteobacteria bacterium]
MAIWGCSKVNNKHTGWVIYFAVGTQLAVSILAGLILGSYADEWMEMETPVFALVGLLAGVASGFTFLIRVLRKTNDDADDDSSKN